jgi:hypothetical protein
MWSIRFNLAMVKIKMLFKLNKKEKKRQLRKHRLYILRKLREDTGWKEIRHTLSVVT